MKIKDLPEGLRQLAEKRYEEAPEPKTKNIEDGFYWVDTPEGEDFWEAIGEGDFAPYYEKYGNLTLPTLPHGCELICKEMEVSISNIWVKHFVLYRDETSFPFVCLLGGASMPTVQGFAKAREIDPNREAKEKQIKKMEAKNEDRLRTIEKCKHKIEASKKEIELLKKQIK